MSHQYVRTEIAFTFSLGEGVGCWGYKTENGAFARQYVYSSILVDTRKVFSFYSIDTELLLWRGKNQYVASK